MCLFINRNSIKKTKKLIEHRKKVSKKNYIIAYKAVDQICYKRNKLSMSLKPIYRVGWGNYEIGENISSRYSAELRPDEICNGTISYGFHVYLNKKSIDMRDLYIPVKIYLDDIVSIGHFGREDSLVCTKFTISEKDYNNPKLKS